MDHEQLVESKVQNELKKPKLIRNIEFSIFESRWILLVFNYGLILGLLVYALVFAKNTIHIISEINALTPESAMLGTLELVDMAMIANLIAMVNTGSYNSFISKKHGYDNANVSSGLLSVKVGISLVKVTSIHLLQTFLAPSIVYTDPFFIKQLIIHIMFVLSSMALAYMEYLHAKGDALEKE